MALIKGDFIDERKRHPGSCGLLVKVMGGGEGFEKILCCDHELTEEDVVGENEALSRLPSSWTKRNSILIRAVFAS